MPFVQRNVEPKFLSRTSLFDEDGVPLVTDDELLTVSNNTLSNALRQLASLVLVANDIFHELGDHFQGINKRSDVIKGRIHLLEKKIVSLDPKKVTVPESDIGSFALLKDHYKFTHSFDTNLFSVETRSTALKNLYESATKTPVHVMRQLDRWRRDGHRSSRFFLCTPVLGAKRRKIRSNVDIDIETHMPSAVEELRRWTSNEALGDITVAPDCTSRITSNLTLTEGDVVDRNDLNKDVLDHKLPSPEEQLQVVALKFPAEIVAVDISGKSFDRMSVLRRSFLHGDIICDNNVDHSTMKRRTKSRKSRNRRRNTLAGTDQKEIQNVLTAGDESTAQNQDAANTNTVSRSKSSDVLRPTKKEPLDKKSHFNALKQWGKSRYDRLMNKSSESKEDGDGYETITMKRKRDVDKPRRVHERNPSISSSEKSSINNVPIEMSTLNVKLRECSAQRRRRRAGANRDEPHSSSGNWSASSESGRASIGSEITSTTQPKSTTSVTTSNNSLNLPPSSVSSRRRFNIINSSASESVTSEGTLTPDIIHDLQEDGETSSVYSCDTEGYYTSFHMDSGLKTLKEEEMPCIPLHFTSAFSNSTVLTAENEYELFGKGSTSTTTSSAGTVCTTLLASESSKSLINGPAVPERKSSLSVSDKTGTIKRSPANTKPIVVALIHKKSEGDISPDSGHNTSSSPIESINSPSGIRSGSECDFSESSDFEGSERIRVKTTINSSRIPSMCVITPPQSDDESVKSTASSRILMGSKNPERSKLELNLQETRTRVIGPGTLVNVNLQSGYATIETIDDLDANLETNNNISMEKKDHIIKSTLEPLNSIFGKLKSNVMNYARRDSKSQYKTYDCPDDFGEYVTIADIRTNKDAPQKIEQVQYISLNDLPPAQSKDSLERQKRQGARVTLDAEGKVVYSSDSLSRKKAAHTTFEPGPFVKLSAASPTAVHRNQAFVRPIQSSQKQRLLNVPQTEFNRPMSPGRFIIKAASGATSPTSEIIRMPPSTIVAPTIRPMSPKPRGAYVYVQDAQEEKDRVSSSSAVIDQRNTLLNQGTESNHLEEMYTYREPIQDEVLNRRLLESARYSSPIYQRFTPDYIRRNIPYSSIPDNDQAIARRKMGIPVEIPQVGFEKPKNEPIKVSPIDPRNTGSFKTSTPSSKQSQVLRSSVNLESQLISPKKSTMSNEELYAIIHKSKKKLNIGTNRTIVSPSSEETVNIKSPETGYIGDNKLRSRSSWSPNLETNKSCGDRKSNQQTSRLDFKRLLLQKSNVILGNTKKISAVEQLKISRDQIKTPPKNNHSDMDILELTGSPRTFMNRKFPSPTSPRHANEKPKSASKIMSPRSQWKFTNPRSDVLSSTILEDCREDENSNNSSPVNQESPDLYTRHASITERMQTQRAKFFEIDHNNAFVDERNTGPPALETSF